MNKSNFVTVAVVNGELRANVLKSRLESEGIPVFLRYEAAGRVYGFSIDGLGEVKVCVPQEYAAEAKLILEEPPGENSEVR
jgi:hypothetical protein